MRTLSANQPVLLAFIVVAMLAATGLAMRKQGLASHFIKLIIILLIVFIIFIFFNSHQSCGQRPLRVRARAGVEQLCVEFAKKNR
jgi:hypothetical protein